MNHNYEDIKEILTAMDIPKSYMKKALNEFGFKKFPKSGLEDDGKNKLIERAIEIAHFEAQLVKRKPKKGYLPLPKSEIETKPSESLEIIVDDWKEVVEVSKLFLKGVAYATAGVTFAIPTMIRKALESEWDDKLEETLIPAGGLFLDSFILYKTLAATNPKLIPYVIATQIGTNIASGIYEYVRHVKNKSEENLITEEETHGSTIF
ncbi:MAG: hypothetical protein WC511_04580 [Candidatus Pacearchaeota archaeon]